MGKQLRTLLLSPFCLVVIAINAIAIIGMAFGQQSSPTQPMSPGLMVRQAFTIANLPTCGSIAPAGSMAYVTNGVASPTFMGSVSTTGSATDPVFCNGSGWVYD